MKQYKKNGKYNPKTEDGKLSLKDLAKKLRDAGIQETIWQFKCGYMNTCACGAKNDRERGLCENRYGWKPEPVPEPDPDDC